QVGVADLVATGALLLASRLVGAADQPGVREELSLGGEAADVVDLVKQNQPQHLADPGCGAQPREGLGGVHLGGARQVQLQVGDLDVVGIDQGQIDLELRWTLGSVKRAGRSSSARWAAEASFLARGGWLYGLLVLTRWARASARRRTREVRRR